MTSFQQSLRQQLVLYKMGSLDPHELTISRDNYVPEKAGLDLGADVSASDLIRLQWAYLLGLLELGLSVSTNHPGLLIMDEPQQQSVEEGAFRAMLEYTTKFKNSQVIVATSHERNSIGQFLKGIAVKNIFEYDDDRVVKRLVKQRGPLRSFNEARYCRSDCSRFSQKSLPFCSASVAPLRERRKYSPR